MGRLRMKILVRAAAVIARRWSPSKQFYKETMPQDERMSIALTASPRVLKILCSACVCSSPRSSAARTGVQIFPATRDSKAPITRLYTRSGRTLDQACSAPMHDTHTRSSVKRYHTSAKTVHLDRATVCRRRPGTEEYLMAKCRSSNSSRQRERSIDRGGR